METKPTTLFLSVVEHYSVPGTHESLHRTSEGALAALCDSLAIVVTDHNETYDDTPLAVPTPENWESVIASLEDYHGAQHVCAYVKPFTLSD